MTDDPNRISLPGGFAFCCSSGEWFLADAEGALAEVTEYDARAIGAAMNAETARADAAEARVRELEAALRPFAAVCEKVERFIADRVADGGSPIMGPTKDWRLSDFRRARAALAGREADLKAPPECAHKGWSFEKHGRCCFACGAVMLDFGD